MNNFSRQTEKKGNPVTIFIEFCLVAPINIYNMLTDSREQLNKNSFLQHSFQFLFLIFFLYILLNTDFNSSRPLAKNGWFIEHEKCHSKQDSNHHIKSWDKMTAIYVCCTLKLKVLNSDKISGN